MFAVVSLQDKANALDEVHFHPVRLSLFPNLFVYESEPTIAVLAFSAASRPGHTVQAPETAGPPQPPPRPPLDTQGP